MREEDAGGREAGASWDLKMPLENGRADERLSRGQASERAVCVCEAVSVEMGAHRPPLPTAVVCLWTLECVLCGNVGIHRAPKAIQVDGS